jgi:hypothetical protein
MRTLVLAAGLLGLTLFGTHVLCGQGWAMNRDEFLQVSEAAQTTYVAGVVDTLQIRRVLELREENPNATASELYKTPFVRCTFETSYGTFRSATLDLMKADPRGESAVVVVVLRAVSRLCPPDR